MKNFNMLLVMISFLAIFNTAHADSKDVVLTDGIKDAKIVVSKSDGLAAVQPYAFIEFKKSSCAKFSLEAQVETQTIETHTPGDLPREILYVSIVSEALQFDCMGIQIDHTYQIQISSDFRKNTQVILKNPIEVVYQ